MKRIINRGCLIFYGIVFYLIFYMTKNYPVHTDEYMYSFIFGTDIKITQPIQLIISSKKMYLEWSGRLVSNFLQQFFIYIGLDIFAILNSFLMILILYFSSKIILKLLSETKYKKQEFIIINILIFIFIWFFTPSFSQDFIWMVGSANYAWPLLLNIILLYYYLTLNKNDKINTKYIILLFLVAVSNESSVIFTGIFMTLNIIIERISKKRIQKNKFFSLIFFSIFSLVLILSPGNLVRIKNESVVFFPRNTIFEKAIYILQLKEFRILMLMIIILLILILFFKSREIKIPFDLFITAILNFIVFIFILPRNEDRALLYPIYELILFLITLIYQFLKKIENKKLVLISCVPIFLIMCSILNILNYYNTTVKTLEDKRKMQLNYYSSINSKEIILTKYNEKIIDISHQHRVYDFLQTDPNYFSNLHMAKYFGFDKIYSVNEDKKLLILEFEKSSDIKTLRLDLNGEKYSALYNFDNNYIKDGKLYLEIPLKTNGIEIKGEGFTIKNIRILKVLEGEVFNSDGNLRKIDLNKEKLNENRYNISSSK